MAGGAALVVGGRDREVAAARAVALGADALVVDSGFQRRRLARDLDLLAISEAELSGARCRLPAGPLRESWASVGRADAVVVVRRPGHPVPAAEAWRWLRRRLPAARIGRMTLAAGTLRPANRAATAREPEPAVAACSVMDPAGFRRGLAGRGVRPEAWFVLPDHGELEEPVVARMLERAADRGIAGTLKDREKLVAAVGERAPVWYLEDEVEWTDGRESLRRLVLRRSGVGP